MFCISMNYLKNIKKIFLMCDNGDILIIPQMGRLGRTVELQGAENRVFWRIPLLVWLKIHEFVNAIMRTLCYANFYML